VRGNKKRRMARMLGKLILWLLRAKPVNTEMLDLAPNLSVQQAKRPAA